MYHANDHSSLDNCRCIHGRTIGVDEGARTSGLQPLVSRGWVVWSGARPMGILCLAWRR